MTHMLADEDSNILKLIGDLRREARAVATLAFTNAAVMDRDGAFPDREVSELHRRGLLLAPFSPATGGCDLGSPHSDPALLADVLATIGRGSLSLGRLFEGHVNAVKLARLYGSREAVALLENEAGQGRLTGVWMAEDGCPLAAARSGNGWRLDGRKILASGAGHIRRPLVAAKTDAGSLLMLPALGDIDRVDLTGWTPAGMKATATGTVDFTGIAVGEHEVVGRPGDYLRSPYFRGGAWRVMAVQLGGMIALLEAHRVQIAGCGRDGDRMQRARFAEATAAVETARLWVREAARLAENPEADPTEVDAYVDLMRDTVERAALLVAEHAQRSLGLKAFMEPNAVERIVRDLSTYLRQPALDASQDAAAAFFFHHPLSTDMA